MKIRESCNYAAAVLAVAVVVLVSSLEAPGAEALSCNPLELNPCLPAFTTVLMPTPQCCSRLEEHQPCLCGYLQNPLYKGYLDSPGGMKILTFCGVNLPRCPPS